MALFSRIKERLGFGSSPVDQFEDEFRDDYVEIDTKKEINAKNKIMVKPFAVGTFDDIKDAINALREGYTIALINIRPLKDKDIVELKRAINKLKKTCDAIEGDIAGVSEDWIVVTPAFAHIFRDQQTEEVDE